MPPPDPSPPKREHPNTLPVTHIDPIPIEVSSDDDSDIRTTRPTKITKSSPPTITDHVFAVRPRQRLEDNLGDINLRGLFAAYPMSELHEQESAAERRDASAMPSDIFRPLFVFTVFLSSRLFFNQQLFSSSRRTIFSHSNNMWQLDTSTIRWKSLSVLSARMATRGRLQWRLPIIGYAPYWPSGVISSSCERAS